VSSPTFTLIHQYGDQAPVYHIDLYRLDEPREVESLGLDELFASQSLILLEWAERFPALLPQQRIEIRLRALADDTREIVATPVG
jgi:tRNA threonylcarbamoyladenosine biosynthesis protein TsaE